MRTQLLSTIAPTVRAFREYVVDDGEGRLSNYLYIFEHDLPEIVDHLHTFGFGLGMFSQDIAESLNRLLKDAFVSFSNRGGGEAGHVGALRQAWERVFLEFHLHLVVNGKPKKAPCQNRKAFRGQDGESGEE